MCRLSQPYLCTKCMPITLYSEVNIRGRSFGQNGNPTRNTRKHLVLYIVPTKLILPTTASYLARCKPAEYLANLLLRSQIFFKDLDP
jgi:hypothetical protein